MELEQNVCDLWNEMSYKRFHKNNRKNSYEPSVFEQEQKRLDWMISVTKDSDYSFETLMEVSNPCGLYEDYSLDNCYGVEDMAEMIEDYN